MLCPSHTSLQKRLRAPLHQRTDAVMLQKARWGRQQAGLHSTLLRQTLGKHAQCYISLSKVLVQDIHMASQGKQVGTICRCLLYKVVSSSSLEPAAARNCRALQESFHACSSLWDALIEGTTNTYRSATALFTQQECINPNSSNRAAGAISHIWQKSKACFLSALALVHKVISKPWSAAFRTGGNSLQDN